MTSTSGEYPGESGAKDARLLDDCAHGSLCKRFAIRRVGPGAASRILRSRELSAMQPDDVACFNRLHVAYILDLRKPEEVAARRTPIGFTAETVTFAEDPLDSPERGIASRDARARGLRDDPTSRMVEHYRRMAHHERYFALATHLLCARDETTLVHCVNGKDRSGVFCAQLLLIAGTDERTVMDDYLDTNRWNAEKNARDLEHLSRDATSEERMGLSALFEAREMYLAAFLNEVNARHGTFDTYVEEVLRLTDDDRETIRRLLDLPD